MPPVSLAFFWHQHQPYYPNDLTGENEFPWVRLHGTKDYWGMARHIQEVPEFRCTINLVPSLLVQLLKYTEGSGSDRHLMCRGCRPMGCRRPTRCICSTIFSWPTSTA